MRTTPLVALVPLTTDPDPVTVRIPLLVTLVPLTTDPEPATVR